MTALIKQMHKFTLRTKDTHHDTYDSTPQLIARGCQRYSGFCGNHECKLCTNSPTPDLTCQPKNHGEVALQHWPLLRAASAQQVQQRGALSQLQSNGRLGGRLLWFKGRDQLSRHNKGSSSARWAAPTAKHGTGSAGSCSHCHSWHHHGWVHPRHCCGPRHDLQRPGGQAPHHAWAGQRSRGQLP